MRSSPPLAHHAVLLLAVAAVAAAALALPPIPQDPAYHQFADRRAWLGIPNALDVLSNAPFLLVGVLGLAVTLRWRPSGASPFVDSWERWPYVALFAGTALTALGSSWFHLEPNVPRLVWDRLPMTVAFIGLLTAVLAERVGPGAARWLLLPLLALGVGSVGLWYWSELRGAGDLRLYLLVQFGSLLLVALLLVLYPPRYTHGGWLVAGLALYAAAKGLEMADAEVLALGGIVSGHTLKHLVAAGGVACVVAMLRRRRPLAAGAAVSRRAARRELAAP